jgi:hypothetical protein
MTTDNFIGVTLWGVAGAPSSNDETGFEALSWVQLKGHQSLPVLGVSHANIDVEDLSTGFTSGVKSMASGRDTTFTFHGDKADPGIASAVTAANDADGVFSLKIVRGSGTDAGFGPAPETGDAVEYAHGYLHSFEPNQGNGQGYTGGSINFKQNAPTVVSTQPAP